MKKIKKKVSKRQPVYRSYFLLLITFYSCNQKNIATFKIINERGQPFSFYIIQPFNRTNENIDSLTTLLPGENCKYDFPMTDGFGEGDFKFGCINPITSDTDVRYFGYYTGNKFPYEYVEIQVDSAINIIYH